MRVTVAHTPIASHMSLTASLGVCLVEAWDVPGGVAADVMTHMSVLCINAPVSNDRGCALRADVEQKMANCTRGVRSIYLFIY